MQVRFKCPACGINHVLDMPETTIFLTCSRTGKHLKLKLGVGGEPKVTIVTDQAGAEADEGDDSEE